MLLLLTLLWASARSSAADDNTFVEISVGTDLTLRTAATTPEARRAAVDDFVANHMLEAGGRCEALPTSERRRRCVSGILAHELEKHAFLRTISKGHDHALSAMAPFFSGEGYRRSHEMLIREVATSARQSHEAGQASSSYPATVALLEALQQRPSSAALAGIMLDEIQPAPHTPQHDDRGRQPRRRLRVVTCASAMTPSLERLKESVERGLGVPLTILCLDEPWLGHGSKLMGLKAWLVGVREEDLDEDNDRETGTGSGTGDVLLFLDAYDTLVTGSANGHAASLIARFEEFGAPVVFSGELNLAPDKGRAHEWPVDCADGHVPLPFLNSGAFMGDMAAVHRLLDDILRDATDNFGLVSAASLGQVDDQRMYIRQYLSKSGVKPAIAIDTFGAFFLSLHDLDRKDLMIEPLDERGEGRDVGVVWSRTTRSAPLVLHGNGNGCHLFNALTNELAAKHAWPTGSYREQRIDLECEWPGNTH